MSNPPPAESSNPEQQQNARPPADPSSQSHYHQPGGLAPAPNAQQILDSNKRTALAGQWRTPPLPVFPTSTSAPLQQSAPQLADAPGSQPMAPPASLPHNSEDYAKALQEAYRRGAEAAAAMAAQQPHMAPSVSCPNFQMAPAPPLVAQQQQQVQPSRSEEQPAPAYAHAPPPPPTYHSQYATTADPNLLHHNHAAPPGHAPHEQQQQQHQTHPGALVYAQHSQTYVASAANGAPVAAAPVPNPLTSMPPPPPQAPTTTAPSTVESNSSAQQQHNHQQQQRSVSMPDMSSYAQQAEEEKRQKRLARNRASARLRRLRKKNLVDAYETEVGILEKTLQQLKAHEWGVPTSGPAATATSEKSHQSLLEALCMDRGQQVISSEQRAQQCQDILEQQLQQMELLRQVQFEQQILAATAGLGIKRENDDDEEDPEMAQMAAELNDVLGLTDEQKSQLQANSKGLDEEMTALDTVFSSLVMMKENEWLLNQGVQDITDQLTSILHQNQMSKFLLWADANVEAIDQLDHVHAAPKTATHPQGPIFTFGVETTPVEDDG